MGDAVAESILVHGGSMREHTYGIMAGVTFLVADYFQTLPGEVAYMWGKPRSFVKVLFLFVRYYIFVHHAILVGLLLRPTHVTFGCVPSLYFATFSDHFVVAVAEIMLFYRVYAFSGNNQRLLVFLVFQYFVMCNAPKVVLLVLYARSIKWLLVPTSAHSDLCLPLHSGQRLMTGVYGVILANELIIVCIMLYIAFMRHGGLYSNLLRVFVRDGIYFYVSLAVLAIGNIVLSFTLPEGSWLNWTLIQMEVNAHIVLACRMVLHLRSSHIRETEGMSITEVSTIHFKSDRFMSKATDFLDASQTVRTVF